MSHTVHIQTEVRSQECFLRTCKRLGLEHGVGKTFVYGTEREGLWVKPHEWIYPVVFDQKTGEAHMDNMSDNEASRQSITELTDGPWGKAEALWKFMREYAKTAAYMSAEESGYTVLSEHETAEGEIELEVAVYA